MTTTALRPGDRVVLARSRLDDLFDALRREGLRVVGPTPRDGAIVYDDLASSADLPAGWGDEQSPGRYRLVRRADAALFAYGPGAHAWRRSFQVPVERLWRARRTASGFALDPDDRPAPQPLALVGARACELAALAVQDRVLAGGAWADPRYAARRAGTFVVAAQCTRAGGTCFCASMGTGPRATAGFDLALTELLDGGGHRFVVEVGTARGAAVLAAVPTGDATDDDRAAAAAATARAARTMGRALDTEGLAAALLDALESPRWEQVAARCLACASCTLVCPTCFCTATVDGADLGGAHAERTRRWDSCFSLGFSYVHGGSVRASTPARYRQWLTHKLATWPAQFGTAGCVGCGRCITWCPAGIDITAEAAAIAAGSLTP